MQISDLAGWVRALDEPSVAPLLAGLQHLLDSFAEIGLGYLSLDRPAGTLSGGEAQRTKMIRHLGSSLTDVTYVFDEPTIGLHPHDIERMNDLLLQLRDKGNTVLVVEHKPETIAIGDHVVDLGPGAGTGGGEVVFEGTVDGLRTSGTLTGRHLDHRVVPEVLGPHLLGRPRGARRETQQPPGRRRRHPARRARGAHRRGRVGEELADPRLGRGPGRRGGGRPGRDPRLAAEQPGDVHRTARAHPQGVRQGQRREAGAVQLQLRGRLPHLQRRRRHLHRAGRHGHRRVPLRGVRGEAVPGRRCWSTRSAAATSPRCSRCRWPRPRSSSATARRRRRPPTRSWTGWPTSGSATSPSASRSPPCPAASGSGSSWPPRWPRRATSTSSTSRPPACTSPTWRTCSACSTGSSTAASRCSSSSTTRRSWRTPTGSSTSARAPATTAAGSSSRAPRRPRRRPRHPHRRAPRGLRRRLTGPSGSTGNAQQRPTRRPGGALLAGGRSVRSRRRCRTPSSSSTRSSPARRTSTSAPAAPRWDRSVTTGPAEPPEPLSEPSEPSDPSSEPSPEPPEPPPDRRRSRRRSRRPSRHPVRPPPAASAT